MAVKIKLKRLGKSHEPHYRIIVADAHTKRDGRPIEELGKYSPKSEPSFIQVNSERVQHWLLIGAQPTEPVQALLRKTGDWQRFKGQSLPEPLQVPEAKPDKKAVFEEAAKEAQAESEQGTQPAKGKKSEGKRSARSGSAEADAKKDAEAEGAPSAEVQPESAQTDSAQPESSQSEG